MDETLSPKQLEALARYSLVGRIVHTVTDRGDITCAIDDLIGQEVLLRPGRPRHFSRATLYRDLKKAKGSVWNLMRKPRRDKGSLHVITQAQFEAFVVLRTESPNASVPVLIRTLENQGLADPGTLHPSTVRRILRDRGLSRSQITPHGRAYRRFEVEGPMVMWQGDASPGIFVGKIHTQLYAWVDTFSRTAVAARYYENQRLPAFDDCLFRAVARFGVPKMAHVDNGTPYISNHFRRVSGDLGIKLIHATPYQPTGKGRVERFFRMVQDQFETSARALVEDGTIQNLDDLNDYLARYLEEYNHRQHSTTKQPPLSLMGEIKPYPDLRRLTEIFLWREERHVGRRGEISIGGNHYAVPDDMVGSVVTVAYRPFDLREVYLEVGGQFLTAKPSVPVRNLAHPKMTATSKKKPTGPADYLRRMPQRPGPEVPLVESLRDTVAAALSAALGRQLRIEEQDLLSVYLARPGLATKAELEERLAAFVRRFGKGQHLSRYLDAIWGEGR
ncbi:MAG: DDE-type integrase/transposase/recombinase [Gammaproteobacteria bacterium]